MQLKDLAYIISIGISAIVAIISLIVGIAAYRINKQSYHLNLENRKNSLREHIYKEQYAFFSKVIGELMHIDSLLWDIDDKEIVKDKSAYIEALNKRVDRLESFTFSKVLLFPDDNFYELAMNAIDALSYYLIELEYPKDKTEMQLKEKTYVKEVDELIDKIRDFIGVEKLSLANLELFKEKKLETKAIQSKSTN